MADMGGNGSRNIIDSSFVRVIVLVVSSLMLPALGWIVFHVESNGEAIAALQAEVPLRTLSRYTADDAKRDQQRTDDRFEDVERRLGSLERKH